MTDAKTQAKTRQQFCLRGHDTFVVGRHQRMCRECRRESDRARYQTPRRFHYKVDWWNRTGWLRQLNSRTNAAIVALDPRLWDLVSEEPR